MPSSHAVTMAMGKYYAGKEWWEYESAEPAKGPLENCDSQWTCRVFQVHSPWWWMALCFLQNPEASLVPLATDPLSPCQPWSLLFSRKALAVSEHDCCLATRGCGYLLASLDFKHFSLPSGTNYWCWFWWMCNIAQWNFNGEEFKPVSKPRMMAPFIKH